MSKSLSLVFVLVAACGGAEGPVEDTQPKPQPQAAQEDPHAVCVQVFERQRDCTDEYIPALVDSRVRHDTPPGIAAKDAELGRDQLVAMAHEEWAADSTDEAIDQTCTGMVSQMTPEQAQQASAQVGACLDADACGAFVDCVIAFVESRPH